MNRNLLGSFGLASMFLATLFIGFDAQVASACSGNSSSGSGLTHGSSMGSGSVTVCVGSGSTSPGSTSTQTITKTVTVKVPAKPKPKKPAKPAAKQPTKPTPEPVIAVVSCPSAQQLASMPRSADASERWVQSICSPAPSKVAAPKPAPKPKTTSKTTTITETITIELPGNSYSSADTVSFYPNPLLATVAPQKVLTVGQSALFTSNPSSHYGVATVLGREAQVHFVPESSGWDFGDGSTGSRVDSEHSFSIAGRYQVVAYVNYQVSYRLLGETSWISVPGTLLVESNVLEILVGAFNLKGDQLTQGALLVGDQCQIGGSSFGC